jgi:hypothetical protein
LPDVVRILEDVGGEAAAAEEVERAREGALAKHDIPAQARPCAGTISIH